MTQKHVDGVNHLKDIPIDFEGFDGHLPGPWYVGEWGGSLAIQVENDDDPSGFSQIAIMDEGDEADAALIVAAPILLERCKAFEAEREAGLWTRIEKLEEAIRRIGDVDANTYNASTPELHAEILKALDLVMMATP